MRGDRLIGGVTGSQACAGAADHPRIARDLGFSLTILTSPTTKTTMFSVLQSIKNLFDVSASPAQDRDDQYLAESSDIYDLERRMRQVDSGRHNLYAIGAYGIFMR